MHIHRLEKIWMIIGITMLVVFLSVVGISAFAMGMTPPGGHEHGMDPAKVTQTAPFDKPGLTKIGENEYEAVMPAFAFGYAPDRLEIPAGATVHFTLTSQDVVHGFQIPGTNVNAMVVPGQISHVTYTFDKAGDYLILCNEYCGTGHEYMMGRIMVTG